MKRFTNLSTNRARRTMLGTFAAFASGLLPFGTAYSQGYPSKPIKLIVPYPPGGGADVVARLLGAKLSAELNTSVVVENRTGASGTVGVDAMARAPADGYTLLYSPTGPLSIAPHLTPPPPYDPKRDFAPIVLVAQQPIMFVVRTDSPHTDMRQFVAASKSNGGKFNFASAGTGTENHLTGELLKKETGAVMTHVPYRGGGPALQATLGGEVDMIVIVTGAIKQFLKDGRVRALAVTTPKRLSDFPDVPTTAELGMPGVDGVASYGVFAPAKTPPDVLQKLERSVLAICEDADFQKRMAAMAIQVPALSSKAYRAFLDKESEVWGDVVRFANIKAGK